MHILLSIVTAFAISFYAIPKIIELAKIKHLFDKPGHRKVHTEIIPTLGGLGIFIGFIIAFSVGVPGDFSNTIGLQYIVAACSAICFVGVKDDLTEISPIKKFIAQFLCAITVVAFSPYYRFHDFDGIFGFGLFDVNSVGSYVLSVFAIVFISNAFNLIDGIDGLAGTLNMISCLAFGIYFTAVGEIGFAVLALSLAASTFAFLIYNFNPAKIFMGDTGSLLLGLVNAILFLKFINIAETINIKQLNNITINQPIVVGLSFIFLPIADCFRVFTMRILKGRSPFSADRNHIHHLLLDIGFNHKQIVFILGGFSVLTIATIFITSRYVLITPMLILMIGSAILLAYFVQIHRNNKQKSKAALVVMNKKNSKTEQTS